MIRRRHPGLSNAVSAFVLGAVALVAVACGGDGSGRSAGGTLDVVASFYPLAFVTERVGGDRVTVTNLTPVGVEPHDLELTPDDVAGVAEADVVVYLAGVSPAVDDAVTAEGGDRAFEVGRYARLDLDYTPIDEGELQEGERGTDPHFWLDPLRLADVAGEVAARLGAADPDGAAAFEANAATLRTELEALDAELAAGLASCENRNLVTSHNAFGYLASRYDLTQLGITGLTPEAEPTPADLAEVARFVAENEVTTIYYETLVSPAIAEAVAAETGAGTAVLDPLEGLSDASEGADYAAIMRANLASLRAGQPCP